MVSPREGTFAWPACVTFAILLAIFLTPKVRNKKTGSNQSVFESIRGGVKSGAARSGFGSSYIGANGSIAASSSAGSSIAASSSVTPSSAS